MNPHIINCLIKGREERIRQEMKQQDYLQYLWWGNYGRQAVYTAVEHCLAGQKAKSKFIEKPIFSSLSENAGLTEEQRYEKEVKRALLAEEQWIMATKRKGLPKTII